MLNYFPAYFTDKAISLYIALLLVVTVLFFSHAMSWHYYLLGVIEVVGFFYFSTVLSRRWSFFSEKTYIQKLFSTALIIRIVWVVVGYFFYLSMTGQPFEFGAADAIGYHEEAKWVHQMISDGNLAQYFEYIGSGYSDMGYPFYLGLQYTLTDDSLIIARLLKAFYSAFTCVLVYRIAKRNFGESVGRMAGIFAMLFPNLILYCGLHVKETEMVLLTVWYIERADNLLRTKNYSFWNIFFVLLLAASLFFFRTVLGATALFSFFSALVFSPSRLVGWKKKIIIGVWVVCCMAYFAGGKISNEVSQYWEMREGNQSTKMEWVATKKGGNSFAKYATGAVMAPMIFAVPFPTMVYTTESQGNQRLIHGGNYDKNIMAFFVVVGLFYLIKRKIWRNHTLIAAFTIGYLGVIAFSAFAHSERFHLPALPFSLIFAAYGVSQMNNKNKIYYLFYLCFIAAVIVGWNWIKLAGRGEI